MLTYIYDDSFEGLLSAIFHARYHKEVPSEILAQADYTSHLFTEPVLISTNITHAERVFSAIRSKISSQALHNIYYTYLSNSKEKGILVYHYLELGWQKGSKLDAFLHDNRVRPVHDLCRKVGIEKHRLLGLVRFRELDNGVYYAPMEPDHNVVPLLAPHFAQRLSDQRWVLHDLKRSLAVFFQQGKWEMLFFEIPAEYAISKREDFYQSLWKNYFENIAIKERTNPRLQKQFMPTRYWKWLIEK